MAWGEFHRRGTEESPQLGTHSQADVWKGGGLLTPEARCLSAKAARPRSVVSSLSGK